MAKDNRRHDITMKTVVYQLAGTDAVAVQRDIPYAKRDGETLTFDVYYPAQESSKMRLAAVLFVTGFTDDGMHKVVGCNAKDMASYTSWAKLMAASGIAAITYTNKEPVMNAVEVFRYVRQHAASFGIDDRRIGVWACSGNVPNALHGLIEMQEAVRCATLCYGFMLDIGDSSEVSDAARTTRFTNPCAGRSLEELSPNVPLFIARASRDEIVGLNRSIDRFVSRALALNLPVTLVNHHTGPHAFDIADDSDMSREIIRQMLAFMRFHLRI